ncbi:MAG: lipid-A-disaccharide synthase-related protein [Synergistetes bacterium]|nr:lipid-A-disaccharide synthase-related protein [Synergistota bacterium]MDW8193109.1 lipid-A-disaccharide synthase-related protein [Synergistota bacterium]
MSLKFLLSSIYELLSRTYHFLYDAQLLSSEKLPAKVISVGNITSGGTGKTPFVFYLAKRLSLHHKVAILSRGYKGKREGSFGLVSDGRKVILDALEAGDEAYLLAKSLRGVPVLVGKDRLFSGRFAVSFLGAQVLILDDGFQYRPLKRDLDIVLIDALDPFGGGKLLPQGLLREPPLALLRADVIVITKASMVSTSILKELKATLRRLNPRACIFTADYKATGLRELFGAKKLWLEGEPVYALCALGNPESFVKHLESVGLKVSFARFFPDHHRYSEEELREVEREALSIGANFIVTTSKDEVNMPPNFKPSIPFLVSEVELELNESESFWKRVEEALTYKVLVLSNGHGEDAIATKLCHLLEKEGFKPYAFPLVGDGRTFTVPVLSPPAILPSGGIVKYYFRDLLRDIKAGLIKILWRQFKALRRQRNFDKYICIGDFFLVAFTRFALGVRPVFLGVAKTVYIRGYFSFEKHFLRKWCEIVLTRDPETAKELSKRGVRAFYWGNPIMDALDIKGITLSLDSPIVAILPGSREQAYRDLPMLLETVYLLTQSNGKLGFLMIPASSIKLEKVREIALSVGWQFTEENPPFWGALRKGDAKIFITFELGDALSSSTVVLGLAGTANQQAAGLGKPVVSVDDKGKRIQKKLLGGAEVLVPYDPQALREALYNILKNREVYEKMSREGKKRMGEKGALEKLISYLKGERGKGF